MKGFHIKYDTCWLFRWGASSQALNIWSYDHDPINIPCPTIEQAREVLEWLFEA